MPSDKDQDSKLDKAVIFLVTVFVLLIYLDGHDTVCGFLMLCVLPSLLSSNGLCEPRARRDDDAV